VTFIANSSHTILASFWVYSNRITLVNTAYETAIHKSKFDEICKQT